ncbi:hypothetical protein [Streptomyces sp. NPDC002078]
MYLCSPETAAASALTGVITDPRTLDRPCPRITEPAAPTVYDGLLHRPPDGEPVALVKGPAHTPLPDFDPIDDDLDLPVLITAGDDVSTDEIMPAGAEALSLWSSLDGMSSHSLRPLDDPYPDRARDTGPHAVVGGRNYGQGSSREQAALAARHLGLRLVLAESIARIHRANLVNYGVLPLTFADPGDRDRVHRDSVLHLSGLHETLRDGSREVAVDCDGDSFTARHDLSPRQVDVLMAGGAIPWTRHRLRECE